MAEAVTLEGLGKLMLRQLDATAMLRADVRQLRRKIDRMTRDIGALQRNDIDRDEAEVDIDAKLDALTRRVEHLEG